MASNTPVRFGVLGAARIVPKALTQPAEQLDCAEVVAIAAREPARAREFAVVNRIPRVVSSYEEIIVANDIEAVYIPLPNSLHCQWTIRALRAGKHVLCEKPIASNAAEARHMAEVANETGLVLAEAFHYRYHPLAAHIRELVAGGCIGRILQFDAHFAAPSAPTDIRFDWGLSGGAMMDLGCYPLNMICYFSGQIPRVIRAQARVGPPAIDVTMEAELQFGRDGTKARITCSMAPDTQPGAWFRATGENGEIVATNPVAPHRGHLLTIRRSEGEQHEIVEGRETYCYQLEAFVAAIRDGEPIATSGSQGVLNMELIDEIYRAAGLPCRGTPDATPIVGPNQEAALK
ncbi:MAG: Gfo/Idh/MocA family oxidoreductase [Deltaproteobacteria bacterium]|nr:Gfo/Idh/MocA family oxidoreductase [Deltaproteobacteria bacterium]